MSEHDVCESDSYVYERIPRDRVSRSRAFSGLCVKQSPVDGEVVCLVAGEPYKVLV